MELRQLQYFVRIVDLGSVSKAAALEAELGSALLVRSTRGVTPTESGRAFYVQAQAVLRQVGRIPEEVQSATERPTGTVAVGMPFSTSCIVAPALVGAVRERLPGVKISVTQARARRGAGTRYPRTYFHGMMRECRMLHPPFFRSHIRALRRSHR